jgi:hypothetical protein
LREAVLELFLSVKIRSDDEIDAYNETLFKAEKLEMKGIDGFALVDMIKNAIEVLMNMKADQSMSMDDFHQGHEFLNETREDKFLSSRPLDALDVVEKKLKNVGMGSDLGEKLFEKSSSTTFRLLQKKLDQVPSPTDSKQCSSESDSSIPLAHREYEKYLV